MAKQITTLRDQFLLRGSWWIRDNNHNVIPGTLSFDPEDTTKLILDGTLRPADSTSLPIGHFQTPCVFGNTIDGKACTIVGAFESKSQTNMPCKISTELIGDQVLIGGTHIDPSETQFESALINLTDFGGWMSRDPFTDSHDESSTTVSYSLPELIKFTVNSLDSEVSISPNFNSNNSYQARSFTHLDNIRIKPTERKGLAWYTEVTFKIRILFGLLVGRPIFLNRVQLCTNAELIGENDQKWRRDYVDLCIRQQGTPPKREFLPPEVPFPYPKIADQFCSILENWFSKSEDLNTVYSLFFGMTVDQSIPTEFQFIAVIQALESYHRTKGDDIYLPENEYQTIRDALTKAIPRDTPTDLRASLKSRINFGNEYALRKRLTKTMDKLPEEMKTVITDGDANFISKVVDTRNYLTHRDESQNDNVFQFREMFNATSNLQLLVQFILLTEIGIPSAMVSDVMRNHRIFANRPRII